MDNVKPYRSSDDLIELLRKRGCVIQDEDFAKRVFSHVGYYRLLGYLLPFKIDEECYVPGTTIERVHAIHTFDGALRALIFSVLGYIEISLSSQIAECHAQAYGPLGYMEPSRFKNKKMIKWHDAIADCLKQNAKHPVMKHHQSKNIPIWVATMFMPFGMVSKLYADLLSSEQKRIARSFDLIPRVLESWLHCCVELRNICAHHGRLYGRRLQWPDVPKNWQDLSGFVVSEADKGYLFLLIAIMKHLFPACYHWESIFKVPLVNLMAQFRKYVDLEHIRFPENWEALL